MITNIKVISEIQDLSIVSVLGSQIDITKRLPCGLIEFTYKGCPYIFDKSDITKDEYSEAIMALECISWIDYKSSEYYGFDTDQLKDIFLSLSYGDFYANDLIAKFTQHWAVNEEEIIAKEREIKFYAHMSDDEEVIYSLVPPSIVSYKECFLCFGVDSQYLLAGFTGLQVEFTQALSGLSVVICENEGNDFLQSVKEFSVNKSRLAIAETNFMEAEYGHFDFSFNAILKKDCATFFFGNFKLDYQF
jgi:hypothetical protein